MQESKSNWLTIKRALQLVVEDTDTAKYSSWPFELPVSNAKLYIYLENFLLGNKQSIVRALVSHRRWQPIVPLKWTTLL